jgi:hypothetical protein
MKDIIKNNFNKETLVKCRYCGYTYVQDDNLKGRDEYDQLKDCERKCKHIINCYKWKHKCSFKEAKKIFLMEMI